MDKFIYRNHAGITTLTASMSDFSYKRHAHAEYSLGVTLHGIQDYYLEGSLQSSHQSGVMLFNPEQVHDGHAHDRKQGLDYIMLYIEPSLFLEALGEPEFIRFNSPIVYNRELAGDIINLYQALDTGREEALCSELLLKLSDNFSSKRLYHRDLPDDSFLNRSREMIYGELGGVLKLDTIAGEFGMSKFKFIRSFKARTGLSPYQFFLNCKVVQARRYLDKYHDLYAAILEFGFVDLSHFNRNFKRVFGVTAHEYLLHTSTQRPSLYTGSSRFTPVQRIPYLS